MPRLRRAEQVERNRELVVDAARRVFLSKGYAGATLEAIADEAGFSKGVVYSQFESKADLFLALLERRIAERAGENERLAGKLGRQRALRTLLTNFARESAENAGWQQLLVEFRIVAARDPALNKRYAAAHAATIGHLGALIARLHERDGATPPYPVRVMAEMIMAVGTGLTLERAADPRALPQQAVTTMVLHALGITDEEAA